MSEAPEILRPTLVPHVRLRWDKVREEHQIVYPEGVIQLNETGAAIVKLCDGRPAEEIVASLEADFDTEGLGEDVIDFLRPLYGKGVMRNAPAE